MKCTLLVLDVDGTLLNDQKEISPHNKATLLKVQQMGVHIVLASGRPNGGIMPLAKELELDHYGGYILSYNGAEIVDVENGEILFEKRINPKDLGYIDKKAKEYGLTIFSYHQDYLFTDTPTNKYVQQEAALNKLRIVGVGCFSKEIDFNPCKCVLASDDTEVLARLENHWKKRLSGSLDLLRSEDYFLEIVPPSVDKGNTLSVLMEMLKVAKEEVIVIGDGVADVTML
ncbi:MAG: Cof-type HAD-IIB family hydrolase, partial [Parabacteroides sp.]|nr:Cof-type HAD-IIB family hydrolase [Parabacteroides sp.]